MKLDIAGQVNNKKIKNKLFCVEFPTLNQTNLHFGIDPRACQGTDARFAGSGTKPEEREGWSATGRVGKARWERTSGGRNQGLMQNPPFKGRGRHQGFV